MPWEQPAPEKVVREVYGSCRRGKIRIFRGPQKFSYKQEDYLCVGLSCLSTGFVALL